MIPTETGSQVRAASPAAGPAATITLTLFPAVHEPQGTRNGAYLTLDELAEEFAKPKAYAVEKLARKDGDPDNFQKPSDLQGFSPCAFAGDRRNRESFEFATMIGLDFDGARSREDVERRLAEAGLEALVYPSFNDSAVQDRFRVLVRLQDPVREADEYKALWLHVNHALGGGADEAASDATRFWYAPACPAGREGRYRCTTHRGEPLDAKAALAALPATRTAAAVAPRPANAPAKLAPAAARGAVLHVEAAAEQAKALRSLGLRKLADAWVPSAAEREKTGDPRTRHQAKRALAGALAFAGFDVATAVDMMHELAGMVGDPDATSRVGIVRDTYAAKAADRPVEGWPTLADVIGEEPVGAARALFRQSRDLLTTAAFRRGLLTDAAEPSAVSGDDGVHDGHPCTEIGNGQRFASQNRGRAVFVPEWAKWLAFDGRRWAPDEGGVRTAALAKDTAREIAAEASRKFDSDDRKLLLKWAAESSSKRALDMMLWLARSEAGMAASFRDLDRDPWLLNVANGTLDLKTGALRPHAAGDMITKLAPVAFDPEATCPRFERFLSEIMAGDAERVEFMRRFLGYCLTGSIREHALCFWYGSTGGNGKSTLAAVLFELLGEYSAKAAPDLLFKGANTDRHPTELADLYGARLVVCNETAQSRTWDEATVKDITGGDPIRARRMREDFWSFDPTHKLVVFGNNQPSIANAADGGLRRRLRLVPFEVSFSAKPDRELDAQLRGEAPGILAYLVQGCLAWQKDGLTEPPAMVAATAEYFADQDIVGRFVAARCDLDPSARVPRKELRGACQAWAEEAGETPPHPKEIARWLKAHGVVDRDTRDGGRTVNGWQGIRLKTHPNPLAFLAVGGVSPNVS